MNGSNQNLDDIDLSDIFALVTPEEQKVFDEQTEQRAKDLEEWARPHPPVEVVKTFERNNKEYYVLEVNEETEKFIRANCSYRDYGYNPETRRMIISGEMVPFILMRFS